MAESSSPEELSPRYTQRFKDQAARRTELTQRIFYRAGEKIDGSAIQSCPGSEIMVVDFEKDEDLREFYERTLEEYEVIKKTDPIMKLPGFFYRKVRDRLEYDLSITSGLETGIVQKELKKRSGLYRRMKQRTSASALDEAAEWPPIRDRKFFLGNYIRIGYGVCRQQAAVVAACMERAIKEKKAPGWMGVEYRANLIEPEGGHAWAAVLNDEGEIYIYDPAIGYQWADPPPPHWPTPPWSYNNGYENHQFGKPGT